MKVVNIITKTYDLDEHENHDGDPLVDVATCDCRETADRIVDKMIAAYASDKDEDGEEKTPCYLSDRLKNGAYLTNGEIEVNIEIEETEMKTENTNNELAAKIRDIITNDELCAQAMIAEIGNVLARYIEMEG